MCADLSSYDHFIHEFDNGGSKLYVPGWKYKGNYGVFDGAMNVGFETVSGVEHAARLGMIPAYKNIDEARLAARQLDDMGKLAWTQEGMIK